MLPVPFNLQQERLSLQVPRPDYSTRPATATSQCRPTRSSEVRGGSSGAVAATAKTALESDTPTACRAVNSPAIGGSGCREGSSFYFAEHSSAAAGFLPSWCALSDGASLSPAWGIQRGFARPLQGSCGLCLDGRSSGSRGRFGSGVVGAETLGADFFRTRLAGPIPSQNPAANRPPVSYVLVRVGWGPRPLPKSRTTSRAMFVDRFASCHVPRVTICTH